MSSGITELGRAIRAYYDRTWLDYRIVWLNRSNLAFHFGYYDAKVRSHREALLNTNATLATIALIRKGDLVLDAGCGLGGSAFWLAEKIEAEIVGVNIVESQVEWARKIAAARNCSNKVAFCHADYVNTGFAPGSFDVVWALESLCHAEDKPAFYREAYRLLKPGGRLIVAEYMLQRAPDGSREEQLLREWLQGWSMPNLFSGPQHLDAATAAGFVDASVLDYTRNVRRSLFRLFALAVLAILPSRALRRLGLRCAVQHGNVVASFRQYQALSRNLWGYGLLRAVRP